MIRGLWVDNPFLDPPWNLAAEEHFITQKSEPVAMLWRNDKSVIIGRNQDYESEVDTAFCAQNGIAVVRRLSGGGAVFHDLGNVNFTYISDSIDGFAGFARPLIAALARMGVQAELSGRNDLLVDGRKISGCAHAKVRGRQLYHGTLLFSADLSDMAGALRVNEEKYKSKGIASVSSRVANLSEWLGCDVEEFMRKLRDLLLAAGEFTPYEMTQEDCQAIDRLCAEKYRNMGWTDGALRGTRLVGQVRTGGGSVEARLLLAGGHIQRLRLTGDFFGSEPVSEIERTLEGLHYDRGAVAAMLTPQAVAAALHGVTREELLDAIFAKQEP